MRWLKWQDGRQMSGYQKMLLFEWKWGLGIDLYLLRYSRNSEIPVHSDPFPGFKHYRANFILKEAKKGGLFYCEHPILLLKRLKVFRSDFPHRVERIRKGSRYVLSLGIVLRDYSQSPAA